MALRNGRRWRGWGALALVALGASSSSQLLADEYPVLATWTQGDRDEITPVDEDVDPRDHMILLVGNEEEDPASGYWIGFYPRILSAEEEQQLGENQPRGVVVNRVLPNSPAVKAKVDEGDIIVGAGDQKINFLDELSQIVQDSAGEPIQLNLLRDGEKIQVQVKPAPRAKQPVVAILDINENKPQQAAEGDGPQIIIEEENEGEGLKVVVAEEEQREPRYWIGISPDNIDQELAEKLQVEAGQGVLVTRVVPDSPAAKAKLADGDIILAAGEQQLTEVEQLAEIVRNSAGQTIALRVRRGNKILEIEVTPAQQGQRRKMLFWRERGEEKKERGEQGEAREKLEGMLRKLRERQQAETRDDSESNERAKGEKKVLGLVKRPQFPMPGAPMTRPAMTRAMVMPGGMPMPSGLPDDMQVTIQKRGNKPAKITVKQGDKLWQTTENELGMLPPEAHRYVFRMLGRPMMPGGFAMPGMPVPGQPQRFKFRIGEGAEKSGEQGNVKWFELRQPEPAGQNDRDSEIREMQEQIQKLRRLLEERNNEKPRLQKKGKNKEKKERAEDNNE